MRDQEELVRQLFLAAAVQLGVPRLLATGVSVDELAAKLGVVRRDRLDGWLTLGATVGELTVDDRGVVRPTGFRMQALVDGDRLVTAFYESLTSFGTGVPLELPDLLAGTTDRADATDEAPTIAAIAELTDPLVHPALAEVLDATAARSLVDVGCGDGRLIGAALAHRPGLRAVGVDQAPAAIAAARERLGSGSPAELITARLHEAGDLGTFDVVATANTAYYCPASELPDLVRMLADLVAPGGALLLATAVAATPAHSRLPTNPVAVASAVLDLQLRCQPGSLRLPTADEVQGAVSSCGLAQQASPWSALGLPYVVHVARRR